MNLRREIELPERNLFLKRRNLTLFLGDAGENNAIKTLLESHSKNVQVSSTKGEIPSRSKGKNVMFRSFDFDLCEFNNVCARSMFSSNFFEILDSKFAAPLANKLTTIGC